MFHLRERRINIFLAVMDSAVLLVAFLAMGAITVPVLEPLDKLCLSGFLLFVCMMCLSSFDFYSSRRTGSCFSDLFILAKGFVLAASLLAVTRLLVKPLPLRIDTLIEFLVCACVSLGLYRFGLRLLLRRMRELGYNVKKVIVLGQSPLVEEILKKIIVLRVFVVLN